MFHKALWRHHQKVLRIPLLLLYVIDLVFLGQFYLRNKEISQFPVYNQYVNVNNIQFVLIPLIFAVIFGCLLMGTQRTNGHDEALMAMPFSRRQIFLSKCTFALSHLVGIALFNSLLCSIILKSFTYSAIVPTSFLLKGGVHSILLLMATFLIVLGSGVLSGNLMGQIGLTGLFIWFPLILLYCIGSLTSALGIAIWDYLDNLPRFFLFNGSYDFYTFTNDSTTLERHLIEATPMNWGVIVAYLILFFGIGYLFSHVSKHENNQMFIVFPALRPYLLGIAVVTFSTFFAEIVSNMYYYSGHSTLHTIVYFLAFFIFVGLTYFVGKRIMQTKYRFVR